jgi:hypothetical protein
MAAPKIKSLVLKTSPVVLPLAGYEAYKRGGATAVKEDLKYGAAFAALAKGASNAPIAGRIAGAVGIPLLSAVAGLETGQAYQTAKQIATEDLPKVRREREMMERNYGTIEAATKTRHMAQARKKERAARLEKALEGKYAEGIIGRSDKVRDFLLDAAAERPDKFWEDTERLKYQGYRNKIKDDMGPTPGFSAFRNYLRNMVNDNETPLKQQYPGAYK